MLSDRLGLEISTGSAVARDAYVAGCDGLLGAEPGFAAQLEQAIAADPGFALAHAAQARAHFAVGDVAAARPAAARARELVAGATARERSHVDALCLAIEGKPVEAYAATRAHLSEHPRDIMVAAPATGVFGLIGFSGRQGREQEQVEFLAALAPALREDWWFQLVDAFALCEVGRLDQALASIERSLAARPRAGHGAHIKAHVLYELGRDGEALEFLDAWMPDYPREASLHCHLSWHQALMALCRGQADRAWTIYRDQVRHGGSWGPFLNTVTDSVSFLWRAELAGQRRDAALWPAARDHALKCFSRVGLAFADVHCGLACVAAGDQENLARIRRELSERLDAGRYPAGHVVPALINGFAAFERGDWEEAIRVLSTALAETVRIGGSRAQRDIVELKLLASLLRSGRDEDAKRLIAGRVDRHPSVPVAGWA